MPRNVVISAVIPVKSNREGLELTVQALRSIDTEKIEIIVVDGGGCQRTKAWLSEHQSHIHHIRSAPDKGIYDAMNYGKSCANGQWVWFVGAGDVPDASTWSTFLNEAETQETSGLHVFSVALGERREAGVPPAYPASWDASMIWRNSTHHQGVLYPRSLLAQHHFDTGYHVLADYALHLELWTNGVKATLHPENFAHVAAGGLSRQFNAGLYLEEWAIKRRFLFGWRKWVHPAWLALKYAAKNTRVVR